MFTRQRQTDTPLRFLPTGLVVLLWLIVVPMAGCTDLTAATTAATTSSGPAGGMVSADWIIPDVPALDIGGNVKVHRLNMLVSNAFLIETDAGVTLVDAGLPMQEGIVLRALKRIDRAEDLKLIYITHAHVDHYGSAAALRTATGAPIAVHKGDAATMAVGASPLGQIRDLEWINKWTLPLIERALAVLPATEPDILLEDGDRLDEFGLDAYVLYTPGHTLGSSTLIVGDNIAFVGDLVSATGTPHAQNSYAFSWQRSAESLARLQELEPELTFAGHGAAPVTQEELATLTIQFEDTVPASTTGD